jgi:hypothetical protein
MTDPNIFVIGVIITAIFIFGVWLTISDFKNIEDGRTERRKHIEEDVKINDRE